MRCIQRVLPAVGFGIIKIYLNGVERTKPLCSTPSSHEFRRGVVKIDKIKATICIFLVKVITSHFLSHLGNTKIIIGIFKCFRYGFCFLVRADKSLQRVFFFGPFIQLTGMYHGIKCLCCVKIIISLHVGIGNCRNTMIADHTFGFAGSKLPYRKVISLIVHAQHGTNEFFCSLRLY